MGQTQGRQKRIGQDGGVKFGGRGDGEGARLAWRGAESGGRLEDDVDCVTDKLFSLPWDYARLSNKYYSATDIPRATKPR